MKEILNDKKIAVFGAFAGAYVLVFIHAILGEFGHSDDFSMLVNYQSGREPFWFNTHFAWGRPLLGIYDGILFRLTQTISDFGWIRLLGIIGTGLFAGLLFHLYAKHIKSSESIFFAIGISTTPAFAVFMGWATCSAHAFASLIALAAGMLAYESSNSERLSKSRLVIACLGLFAAECIYQPAASFFLLPLIIGLTFANNGRIQIRQYATPLAAFVATVVVYFIFSKAVTNLFFKGTWLAERMQTDFDLLGKLTFLVSTTVPTALGGWGAIFGPTWKYVFIIATALLGMAYFIIVAKGSEPFKRTVLILIACGLGVAPLVAAGENYTPPRTLPYVYGVLFHFCAFTVVTGIRKLPINFSWWIVHSSSFTLLFLASTGVYVGFVKPGISELNAVRDQVRRSNISNPEMPWLSCFPQWHMPPGTERSFYEFGSASSWQDWGADGKVTLILREQGIIQSNAVAELITVGRYQTWNESILPVLNLIEAFG
ncbi:MAG: hypothetical protein LR015_04605, partial [Verrucomicrobia bacterium]|nr:hypothetical protein [Verrucomicrobiota bacterium]